jgi:sugar phosphate permease
MKITKMVKQDNRAYQYRWLIWSVMVLAYLLVYFHRLTPGVLQSRLVDAFDLSATSFATLSSMYFYAYMIMQIPVGILADTLGARITVTSGMVITAAGSFMFGTAIYPAMAFAGRFIIGIGVSTVFVSILKINSRWFKEREFATMSGLTLLVGNAGGMLAQTPLAALVTVVSWRHVFTLLSLVSLVLAALAFLLVRNEPSSLGFDDINEFKLDTNREKDHTLGFAFRSVLSNWRIWPAMIFYAFINGSWLAFVGTWGVPYVSSVYGLPEKEAALYIIWAMLGMLVGCFTTGWISDKTGRRKFPMVVLSISYTLIWGIISIWNGGKPPLVTIKPLFFLMGFGFTSFILSLSVVKELNMPRYTGVALSVFNTSGFVGVPLIATLSGYIIDVTSGMGLMVKSQYHWAFLAVFILLCLGTSMLVFMPETYCENINCHRVK